VLSSPIIDLAIGLTFVFGVTAALASFITELISRLLGLRSAYLLSGLRELVDGGEEANLGNAKADYDKMTTIMKAAAGPATKPPDNEPSPPPDNEPPSPPPDNKPSPPPDDKPPSMTAALLGGPILRNQGIAGSFYSRNITLERSRGTGRLPKMTPGPQPAPDPQAPPGPRPARGPNFVKLRTQLRSLPSYISAESFAEAVIDLVVPNATGQTTMDVIQKQVDAMPDLPLKPQLQALVKEASGDVIRFHASVEKWYDDHMDRVSGWYKRHVAKITLAAGAIIIVLLNLNVLTIGRTLYTENAVSAAVSNVAAKTTSCSSADQSCLANLDSQLSAAAASGLPVGWGTVRACTQKGVVCGWWERRGILSPFGGDGSQAAQVLLVLLGFLIMIISLVPGAQFWFGLLTKLNTLRTTGPPPASAPSNPVSLTVVPSAVASPPAVAAVAAAAPSAAPVEQQPPPGAG
jgi:hypothetical protein